MTHPPRSPAYRALKAVFDAAAAVGTVWIFVVMMMIVADVVGRNLLSAPISGVAEIAARSVVAIVFLMLPAAALNGTLIRADFLIRLLRRGSASAVHAMDGAFALVGAAVFALVAIASWPDTAEAWRTAEFFGVRGVWTLPTFPFRLIVAGGSAATALGFAAVALGALSRIRSAKAH